MGILEEKGVASVRAYTREFYGGSSISYLILRMRNGHHHFFTPSDGLPEELLQAIAGALNAGLESGKDV